MFADLNSFLLHLATERAVLVTVGVTKGSVPRETGAWMAVFSGTAHGTIGGGHLEWDAMRQAREALAQADAPAAWEQSVVLGPSLGQCCGGALVLQFEPVNASHIDALRAPERGPDTVGLVWRRACGARDRAGAGATAIRCHLDRQPR